VVITIKGQVRGGKNNMLVLRNGMHIPSKKFKEWRDDALEQVGAHKIMVKNHYSKKNPMITVPCMHEIEYFAGDHRRRDIPAILDAVYHVLERAGVVKDDCLLKDLNFRQHYDKENPRVIIKL
jgi:Holliday junction resolvase RusA-like endonuclease